MGLERRGGDLLPSGWYYADGRGRLLSGDARARSNESTDTVLCNLACSLSWAALVVTVPWIHFVCHAALPDLTSRSLVLADGPRGQQTADPYALGA